MSDPPAPAVPAGQPGVDVRVAAAAFAGMVDAADAFLGPDPDAACAVLAAWREEGGRRLAFPGGAAWAALDPVGPFTLDGPAGVLRRILTGTRHDAEKAARAIAWARAASAELPDLDRLDLAGDTTTGLWRRALLTAVEEFWALATAVYATAHTSLAAGDRAGVEAALRERRTELQASVERIALLSHRVVGTPVADVPQVEVPAPPAPVPVPLDRLAAGLSVEPAHTQVALPGARVAASPSAWRRRFRGTPAAVVFLLLVMAAAGWWLMGILDGTAPLLP